MQLGLTLGPPSRRGGLTLYPVFRTAPAAPDYLAGPRAADLGVIATTELDDGPAVPELQVHNTSDLPVLLVEGEMLLGAKQNRTLNLSVLCPAASTTRIPVSCVERGRWGRPHTGSRSAYHAPLGVRFAKTASSVRNDRRGAGKRSDQGEVWHRVDERLAATDSPSPTAALEDAFEAASQIERPTVEDLHPVVGQVGVLAAAGGTAVLDLFDKPETLAAYWGSLLQGYALDAIGASPSPVEPDAGWVDEFLARLEAAEPTPAPASGLGREAHLDSGDLVGAALLWDDALVHLSAYTTSVLR